MPKRLRRKVKVLGFASTLRTAAIIVLGPQVGVSSRANGNESVRAKGIATAEGSVLVFRIGRNVQSDGKAGVQVEVQARVTNDEVQDRA